MRHSLNTAYRKCVPLSTILKLNNGLRPKKELVCVDCLLKYHVGFTTSSVSDEELYLGFEVKRCRESKGKSENKGDIKKHVK